MKNCEADRRLSNACREAAISETQAIFTSKTDIIVSARQFSMMQNLKYFIMKIPSK